MQPAGQSLTASAVQLRYMSITFEQELPPYKTASFRGAIAKLMHAYPIFSQS